MKFSIKYKIFLLTLIIPVISLLLYMEFASGIFREDKMAYVFSQGAEITKARLRLATSLKEVMDLAMNRLEKDRGINPISFKQEFPRAISWKFFSKPEDHPKLGFKILDKNKGSIEVNRKTSTGDVLSLAWNAGENISAFEAAEELYFLIDKEQNSIGSGTLPSEIGLKSLVKKLDSVPSSTGSLFYSEGGKEWLLSFTRSRDKALTALRLVPRSDVLTAIHILERKSLVFFVVIGLCVLMISLISAAGTTYRLRVLNAASNQMEEGVFSVELVTKGNDEVAELSRSFKNMTFKIQDLIKKLREHNERLEITVAERTRELREALRIQGAMVESLGEGFIIYSLQDKMQVFTTASSEKLLGQNLRNQGLSEVLGISEKENFDIDSFLNFISEKVIPFEDLTAMLPTDKTVNNRILFFRYKPILEDGNCTHMVIGALDRTDEIRAIQEAKNQVSHAKMLSSLLRHRKEFQEFVNSISSFIDKNFNPPSADNVHQIAMDAHTLKGSAGLLNLNRVAESIHRLEDVLSDKDHWSSQWNPAILDLRHELDLILNSEVKFVGIKVGGTQKIEVSKDKLVNLITLLQQENPKIADNLKRELLYTHASELMSFHETGLRELSANLGQKIKFTFGYPSFSTDDERMRTVLGLAIHVYRNALSHAFETPEERIRLGKNAEGEIKTVINLLPNFIEMKISDDGKGIDENQIKKILGNESKKIGEKANLLSGRGVGVAAVLTGLQKIGGKVEVVSEVTKGTTFILTFPCEYHVAG